MPMQSSPFPTTTLMLLVCSFLAGGWASIACTMWLSYWSHCNCTCVSSSHLAGHFSISVIADADLMKSVLETSRLLTSLYKAEHPSDTEDRLNVGLSSKDEAEGLLTNLGRAHRGIMTGPSLAPKPTEGAEVVVKRRALRRVKQQVSALLRGEDLPEGAQAREVAEVPYQLPPVARDSKECPICQQVFKTHHRLLCHMGVTGEKSSPVKSVAKSWQLGRCRRLIQLPVCRGRGPL